MILLYPNHLLGYILMQRVSETKGDRLIYTVQVNHCHYQLALLLSKGS